MINWIDSSISTFKRVDFHAGLNVLLSDSQPDATEKQTRNSAGKTSVIEIIHFLMGSKRGKDSLFRTDALINDSFSAEFEFWGEKIAVERSGQNPARGYLLNGLEDQEGLPIKTEKDSERRYFSNENWKAYLGHKMFNLPLEIANSVFGESFTPSFRAMISYFIRRQNSGGFTAPEYNAARQLTWDWQENLSYLFGLEWRIAFDFQQVRAREKMLDELKKATKGGALGEIIGTVAELRSQVTVAECNAAQKRSQIESFQVLDSYNELAQQAARAKNQMQALTRETVSLRETLDYLQRARDAETPPDPSAVEKLYSSAGVELPGVALRRLSDVRQFYESAVENRKQHLDGEIQRLERSISESESRAAEFDSERRQILQDLQSYGALEDFLSLQKQLAELEAEAASLRERFKAAGVLEGEKTQIDIDRGNLHQRLQQDFQERRTVIDEAILEVTDAISELYEDREGKFELSASDSGPRFKVSIEGERGGGISNMEIFCFDLALFKLNSSRNRGPGFLVHDSHLFDGVDERQIARALSLGIAASEDDKLQYIVTMNSDIFDRLPLDDNIDRDAIVLGTRLSDESDSGGLFGFRFD